MKIKHNELTTSMPDNWEDRTMITLVAPFQPGAFAVNVVITRHPVAPSQSVEDFAAEQMKMLINSLPGFELLDRRNTTVQNFPASQQLHRFQTENGIFQQVQTFILCGAVIFSMTGTAPLDEFDSHIAAFRQIVENFEFNADTF